MYILACANVWELSVYKLQVHIYTIASCTVCVSVNALVLIV